MIRLRHLALAVFLTGCPDPLPGVDDDDAATPAAVEEGIYSGSFELPERPTEDSVDLPAGPDGGLVIFQSSQVVMTVHPDQRTPVSAAAECAVLTLSCFSPGERDWLGCFRNLPTCTSDEPWLRDDPLCCPSSCGDRYLELRATGLPAPDAAMAAIYGEDACIPGLNAYVGDGG